MAKLISQGTITLAQFEAAVEAVDDDDTRENEEYERMRAEKAAAQAPNK